MCSYYDIFQIFYILILSFNCFNPLKINFNYYFKTLSKNEQQVKRHSIIQNQVWHYKHINKYKGTLAKPTVLTVIFLN